MKYVFMPLIAVLVSFVSCVSAQNTETSDMQDGGVIKRGSYTITFSKAKAAKIPDLYSDQAERDKATKNIDNGQRAAQAVEKYLAKKTGGKYFKRSGENLTLFLENGKKLTLVDQGTAEDGGDDYEGYNFEHFFEKNNFYLIRVQFYEGNAYMLVDRKTGAKEYIIGHPYFSPLGKKVIAIGSDLLAGYNDHGVQLLTIKGNKLTSEFTLEPSSWGPVAAKWLSENEVLLEKEKLSDDGSMSVLSGGFTKMTIK